MMNVLRMLKSIASGRVSISDNNIGERFVTTQYESLHESDTNTQSSDDYNIYEMNVRDAQDAEFGIINSGRAQIITSRVRCRNEEDKTMSYRVEKVIGTGSFGVVFEAKCLDTGEQVAIKKVLQDRRYQDRELQIMTMLEHPNVVELKHSFFSRTMSNGVEEEQLFLNLVLEFVPETVYSTSRHFTEFNDRKPLIYVQLYTYQICRAMNYLHRAVGVCHRDIKPQNILVNTVTHEVKICDFGSAKMLVPGEPNIPYICSRYYRAPELMFGETEYTTAVDMWSVGCVMAELMLGKPLFVGESSVDQLVEIIKILGTPTREDIKNMNPHYNGLQLRQVKAQPWHKIFRRDATPEAMDLASRLLQYSPNLRYTALEACAHPFFDDLRNPRTRLPNGNALPRLFDFTLPELADASAELRHRLIPEHARKPVGSF